MCLKRLRDAVACSPHTVSGDFVLAAKWTCVNAYCASLRRLFAAPQLRLQLYARGAVSLLLQAAVEEAWDDLSLFMLCTGFASSRCLPAGEEGSLRVGVVWSTFCLVQLLLFTHDGVSRFFDLTRHLGMRANTDAVALQVLLARLLASAASTFFALVIGRFGHSSRPCYRCVCSSTVAVVNSLGCVAVCAERSYDCHRALLCDAFPMFAGSQQSKHACKAAHISCYRIFACRMRVRGSCVAMMVLQLRESSSREHWSLGTDLLHGNAKPKEAITSQRNIARTSKRYAINLRTTGYLLMSAPWGIVASA